MTSARADGAPLPTAFVAKTEKAYPAQEDGQVTVIGDADPGVVIPAGSDSTV